MIRNTATFLLNRANIKKLAIEHKRQKVNNKNKRIYKSNKNKREYLKPVNIDIPIKEYKKIKVNVTSNIIFILELLL